MKKVLSLLVIFVLLNVNSWAFAPNYGGTGAAGSLSGTYAGVFIPTNETTTSSASLGVFAIAVPSATSGTVFCQGVGFLFSNGAGYNATINGVLDPATETLSAIIDGISNFTVVRFNPFTGTSTTFNIDAQGSMNATLKQSKSGDKAAVSGPGTASAERLIGTASIDLFSTVGATGPNIDQTITFTVNGFLQTSSTAPPTLAPITIGG